MEHESTMAVFDQRKTFVRRFFTLADGRNFFFPPFVVLTYVIFGLFFNENQATIDPSGVRKRITTPAARRLAPVGDPLLVLRLLERDEPPPLQIGLDLLGRDTVLVDHQRRVDPDPPQRQLQQPVHRTAHGDGGWPLLQVR